MESLDQGSVLAGLDVGGAVRWPQLLFCGLLALSLARTLPALVRFYAWFKDCGLELAKHRGYGQTGCRLYGLIPGPFLSVPAMAASGVLYLTTLLVMCVPGLPPAFFAPLAIIAVALYHCYMSQLFPESGTRASVTCLNPPVLILLALCPVLNGAASADDLDGDRQLQARVGAFTAWLVKCLLFWAYCAAGISKVLASVRARRAWWDGSTLQAYIFEALNLCKPGTHWSYGIPTPFSHEFQRFFFFRPTLLYLLAVATMVVELFAPVVLLMPAWIGSPCFAVVGLGLHYGIAYFQNIDFLSWWGPVYAFFVLDPAAMAGADPALFGPAGAARAAFSVAPACSAAGLGFILLQPIASIVLQFCPKFEALPFSRFGMFDVLRDLFDPSYKKVVWLSEKPHATGTLNNYTFGPCYRSPHITPAEYELLPFRYLQLNYGGDTDEIIHANFKVEGELLACINRIRAEGSCGPGVWHQDPDAPVRLYGHLRAAQKAFNALPPFDKAKEQGAGAALLCDGAVGA